MIRYVKVKKKDLDRLIEFKLQTILPYLSNPNDKLRVISYVNNYMKDNYIKCKYIVNNFKVIGAILIDNEELDMLYIKAQYRNKGIGSKVLKRFRGDIKRIILRKRNSLGLKFYQKNEYILKQEHDDIIELERV